MSSKGVFFYMITTLCFLLLTGCQQTPSAFSPSVDLTLKIAGKNKSELQKVMAHYHRPQNKLKFKAAVFLIENMADQYHYQGKAITGYQSVFQQMDSLLASGKGIFNHSWDSLQALSPSPALNTLEPVSDAQTVSSSFLISHIEAAFRAWKRPWARQLTFEEFCQYLLPYKLLNEQPQGWMMQSQAINGPLFDSLGQDADMIRVCKSINQHLRKKFYINARFQCNWDMTYADLLKTRTGKCSHASQFTAYTMRSAGVPVVMDYTPHWANKDFSHQWNALLKPHMFFFMGTESDPGANKIAFTRSYWIKRKRGKIFRVMYAFQPASLAMQVSDLRTIPAELRSRHIKDVTSEYVPTGEVRAALSDAKKEKFVYLCVFNDHQWFPMSWSGISLLNKARFADMEKGVVYLPAYFQEERIIPAGYPVILQMDGGTRVLKPDFEHMQQVLLERKYPEDQSNVISKGHLYDLLYWNNNWISIGTQRALSEKLSFSDVPRNALLILRDLDHGRQERIFTFENSKQVWW